MAVFLAKWEQLKKDFDKEAKKVQNPDAPTKAFLAVMAKPLGFTPILKDIDEAFKKGHRKPAMQALLKFYSHREPYSAVFTKAKVHRASIAIDDELMMAINDLSSGIVKLEAEIQTALKNLQDTKGPGGDNPIKLHLFEVDLEKNIETLKKDLKPLAVIEKKHNVLKLIEPGVKLMNTYTKAAARTQAQEAHDALTAFVVAATKCKTQCDAILTKEKDPAYTAAVQRFTKDLIAMCNARVKDQVKALVDHLAA